MARFLGVSIYYPMAGPLECVGDIVVYKHFTKWSSHYKCLREDYVISIMLCEVLLLVRPD